jgi:hypothetical protein
METCKATQLEQRMAHDFEWAASAPEVQQNPEHYGKLVAIYDRRILAVGRDRQALVEMAAREAAVPGQHLVVVLVPRPGLWETPR